MKHLLDGKNKIVASLTSDKDQSPRLAARHLSGTRTAYLINFNNYRTKLMGSITKHLEVHSK